MWQDRGDLIWYDSIASWQRKNGRCHRKTEDIISIPYHYKDSTSCKPAFQKSNNSIWNGHEQLNLKELIFGSWYLSLTYFGLYLILWNILHLFTLAILNMHHFKGYLEWPSNFSNHFSISHLLTCFLISIWPLGTLFHKILLIIKYS